MFKLYQYTTLIIIILSLVACGGSSHVKKEPSKKKAPVKTLSFDKSLFNTMTTEQKLNTSQQLLAKANNTSNPEKNSLLNHALLINTQILIDYHQANLLRDQSLANISTEHYEQALQLSDKIIVQVNTSSLSIEQKNNYQLMFAIMSLTNYQAEDTLIQLAPLNEHINSQSSATGSMFYQIHAMAEFQSGQSENAVKDLIIRHYYLLTPQDKQHNQQLIWHYLAGLSTNEKSITSNTNKVDHIYTGWLELAHIIRTGNDSQILQQNINIWIQNYPEHPADRTFIHQTLLARQASMLTIKQLAVLLPLQGKLAKPAKAILDGIMASHYQTPLSDHLELRFYDTNQNQSIDMIYQQATSEGADFIIGPLAKNKLEILAQANLLEFPTLALNSLENRQIQTPENLFQFGLSPEASARMVATKARQEGHYYAALITPKNKWGQRMKSAFELHWVKLGGIIAKSVTYQAENNDFSTVIKKMLNSNQSEARRKKVSHTIGRKVEFTPRIRHDIDMIFMAALPRQAKQIPLQIIYHHGDSIPIYSTPKIVANYHDSRHNLDMDGVQFFDMPFLLDQTIINLSQNNPYQNTLYQRLFAMGVDSYQLAPHILYLQKNPAESFSGDSGLININFSGHIIRNSPWATFEQGHIKLLSNETHPDNATLY